MRLKHYYDFGPEEDGYFWARYIYEWDKASTEEQTTPKEAAPEDTPSPPTQQAHE